LNGLIEVGKMSDRTLAEMSSVRRGLGVLGGTFDPPHIGHLAAAIEVREALCLEQVLLMVANEPWQKVDQRVVSPACDRFAMTAAAVEGIDGLAASELEISRGGSTFTIDTLEALHEQDEESELFLIVGADAAAGLSTWHRHRELPRLATLVIVDRAGEAPSELPSGWDVERVTMPRIDISSSELRTRIGAGGALFPYLPLGVIDEIHERGLYGLSAS
jgi:nicotinate-nucleotide adenylyltransferase